MHIIDLSHALEPNMPLYPGTAAPRFEETASIENDGYREKRISLCVHTGTHVDAPAHLIKGAQTLDQLPLEMFYAEALLLNVSAPGKLVITMDDLTALDSKRKDGRFLLLRTDWSRHWGCEDYFSGYPTLSQAAARWLAQTGIIGVGLDALSADPLDAPALPIHHILLGAGMIIVENLTHLSALPEKGFIFSCLPLNIVDADGSPVRAVAVLS
ncbi:cyclase family protein [Desulfosarcina variabilis str. Montpellier]|uniref:cyclase family protein n=1 Tax=Desulfosarcina variabilis TaxID=2300 RepID=UPI003AFB001C